MMTNIAKFNHQYLLILKTDRDETNLILFESKNLLE
jgi:hypothetical protein